MNPYATDPADIPSTDLYADLPLYGRYRPQPDDFAVDPRNTHIEFQASAQSASPDTIKYWESVLDLYTESIGIYPADEGGRGVFALGNVVVKSRHLHVDEGQEVDFSFADANEVAAINIAKDTLQRVGVKVPEIYFAGKVDICSTRPLNDRGKLKRHQIRNQQVLIQERLPGVALNVAWPYLSQDQRTCFKNQARKILESLHRIKPDKEQQPRSHIIPDPNIYNTTRSLHRQSSPEPGRPSLASTRPPLCFMLFHC